MDGIKIWWYQLLLSKMLRYFRNCRVSQSVSQSMKCVLATVIDTFFVYQLFYTSLMTDGLKCKYLKCQNLWLFHSKLTNPRLKSVLYIAQTPFENRLLFELVFE